MTTGGKYPDNDITKYECFIKSQGTTRYLRVRRDLYHWLDAVGNSDYDARFRFYKYVTQGSEFYRLFSISTQSMVCGYGDIHILRAYVDDEQWARFLVVKQEETDRFIITLQSTVPEAKSWSYVSVMAPHSGYNLDFQPRLGEPKPVHPWSYFEVEIAQ